MHPTNKHRAAAMFFSRSIIIYLFIIGLITAIAEGLLFAYALRNALVGYDAELGGIALETTISRAHISFVATVGFLALCAVVSLCGCRLGSRVDYTIDRLRISRRAFFFWHAAIGAAAFVIYWATQVLVSLLLCRIFVAVVPAEAISTQTIYLALWRCDYLHCLLPLSDVLLWVRNILLAATLGLSAAAFAYRQREGRFGNEIIALAAATIVFFEHGLGGEGMDVILIILALFVSIAAVNHVCLMEKEKEEDA